MPAKAALLTLVLLPGFHGTADLFKPLLQALPKSQRARVLELPGGTIRRYEDLDPWINACLAKQKDYVLVAESFSSQLAIRYASTQPPGLRGLVTLGGFAHLPGPRWTLPLVSLIPSFSSLVIARPRRRLLFGPDATPDQDAVVVRALERYSTPALRGRLRALLRGDQRPLLATLTLPRLAIHGDRDAMIPRQAWEVLVASGFEGKLVEGPHALAFSSAQASAAAIRSFVRKIR